MRKQSSWRKACVLMSVFVAISACSTTESTEKDSDDEQVAEQTEQGVVRSETVTSVPEQVESPSERASRPIEKNIEETGMGFSGGTASCVLRLQNDTRYQIMLFADERELGTVYDRDVYVVPLPEKVSVVTGYSVQGEGGINSGDDSSETRKWHKEVSCDPDGRDEVTFK